MAGWRPRANTHLDSRALRQSGERNGSGEAQDGASRESGSRRKGSDCEMVAGGAMAARRVTAARDVAEKEVRQTAHRSSHWEAPGSQHWLLC